ncbi:MAG: HlyD family secretion protein [Desulfomonilia bacterium]|jgi:membrane fusion protein (multidrug efflux system)
MNKWAFRLLVIGIVLAGIYAVIYFVRSLSYESTDDAYVAGVIVPVSAEVRGKVVKVYIKDNQEITAGNPLLEIFRDDYTHGLTQSNETLSQVKAEDSELHASVEEKKKALVQAKANLDAARAEEDLADKDVKRYERLLKRKVVAQSQFDTVQSRWKVAQARREAAEAAVAEAGAALETLKARLTTQGFRIKEAETSRDQARLNLLRTVVTAPMSGRIAMKNVDPGKYVEPGQPLLSIVKEDTWVIANFKETQIKKMSVGQPVEVKVDAYPGKVFKGHVDSVQPGTGAVFSLLPPENATGNFVKVVQRVPVKIIIDSRFDPVHPLWPGLSVVPSVDITRQTGPKLMKK